MDWLDELLSKIGGGFTDFGSKAADWLGEGLKSIPSTLTSADFLVPAAIAGGGMLLQNSAINKAARQQQDVTNRGIEEQAAMQAPITQALDQMTYERSTPAVQAETDKVRTRIAGNLDDYIGAARASFPEEARSGRVSSDYTTGAATMKADEAARRAKMNSAWANLMAPQQQQTEQGLRDLGYASTIGNATADAGTLASANALDASKIQPSGSKMLIGDLAKAGGSAFAMNSLLRPKTGRSTSWWSPTLSGNPDGS